MSNQKISSLLALSFVTSPLVLSAATQPVSNNHSTAPSIERVSNRTSIQRMKHLLAASPLLQPMGTYVGELQERWQFPSDHLPIAMSFDDLNIVSWNVLDAEYMNWVTEKNSQGLSRSMIADEHVYLGDTKLTLRDRHIADLILQMTSHPTHPRSILSLQECSGPFLEELRSRLPSDFEIISNNGNAVVMDRRRFDGIETKEISGVFTATPYRTIQDITLRRRDNGQSLRLVNVHLPGDPEQPARFEFARYLAKTFNPHVKTIAMGDMNFNELEMADAMHQAFLTRSPFSLYSPYCTNISPRDFFSKAIDHFFFYSPDGCPVTLNSPNQILPGLDPIASLLQRKSSMEKR